VSGGRVTSAIILQWFTW